MTKVLVTGTSGFIGKHLARRLHNAEYEFIAVDHSDGDIADQGTWSHLESADVLVHLAGSTFVPDSWQDPATFLRTNIQGVVRALDYCRNYGSRLIYLSSYLYGNPSELPIAESSPLDAGNPYALSKKLAEELCGFYARFFGVKVVILRPFNVYGPGQSEHFLIPYIIRQVSVGDGISVKDLEPRRDYIFIDDLVEAIIMSFHVQSNFSIMNIGTGVSYSVAELITIIQEIRGTNLHTQSTNERRHAEVMDSRANITEAARILGWYPKVSLRSGLECILR